MPAAGLQTHIWNNNLKSGVLLAFYPVILLLIIWAIAYLLGLSMEQPAARELYNSYSSPYDSASDRLINGDAVAHANNFIFAYWPIILGVVAGWFLISYFFHTRMIAGMAHAKPVTRQEEPELYNLLENLCIAEGVTMPQFNIIETHALNAFASGINEKNFTITVTRGLLNRLSKDEVEGVLAHELTHIINRDVRLMMITIVFTGMVALAAQLAWSHMRFAIFMPRGGGNRKGGALFLMLAIAAILWIGYLATIFTRFAISRKREYMADGGAVAMTRNPEAMMRALMRISGRDRIPEATDDIAFMCIENTKRFLGLFATHPPTEKRIEAIAGTTGTDIPQGFDPVADKQSQISNDTRHPWLPRERGFRKKDNPWT